MIEPIPINLCIFNMQKSKILLKGRKNSNDSDILTIPLDLAGCMVHFKHELPKVDDMSSLKQYCLAHGDTPWNLSLFSDQMANKFYQHIIDTESCNTCLDPTTRNQTLFFYDPSDTQI
jgi:hypothetical protein